MNRVLEIVYLHVDFNDAIDNSDNESISISSSIDRAMTLSSDPDIRHQRGLILYQMKNYRKSLNDFNSVAMSGDSTQRATLYNYIGMCEGQLGNSIASIEAHKKSLECDPNFKEAKLNFAQIHKDLGNFEIAGTYVRFALKRT